MHEGKQRRLDRIFAADGRTLIVAMDHAAYMPDVVLGLEHPGDIITKISDAGADAVMTTLGTIRKCAADIGSFPLIQSVEVFPNIIEDVVLESLRLNVDLIKCMVYPWSDQDADNLLKFQRLALAADKWCLPIMAEVFPGGFQAGSEWRSVNRLAAAARVTAEAGADVIKTFFVEDTGDYRKVTDNCPVPLVVLGGEKSDDPRPLLEKISRSMEAGASGVAIGRNIWRHPKPAAITAAIAAIVHGGSDVDGALKYLS